jgi:hypothetical protein
LTWALRQQEEIATSKIKAVVELGVGMAGLAALTLVASNIHANTFVGDGVMNNRIILTDGHTASIRNNRVNIRLLQAVTTMIAKDDNQCSLSTAQMDYFR